MPIDENLRIKRRRDERGPAHTSHASPPERSTRTANTGVYHPRSSELTSSALRMVVTAIDRPPCALSGDTYIAPSQRWRFSCVMRVTDNDTSRTARADRQVQWGGNISSAGWETWILPCPTPFPERIPHREGISRVIIKDPCWAKIRNERTPSHWKTANACAGLRYLLPRPVLLQNRKGNRHLLTVLPTGIYPPLAPS